jgi:hypothetical protein
MITRDYLGLLMGISVPEYAILLSPVCIHRNTVRNSLQVVIVVIGGTGVFVLHRSFGGYPVLWDEEQFLTHLVVALTAKDGDWKPASFVYGNWLRVDSDSDYGHGDAQTVENTMEELPALGLELA